MRPCRGCGAQDLHEILDLGHQPLANELPDAPNADADRFRLVLTICGSCGLVQIDETVDPERLFRHYVYRSSFADEMLAHAAALVDRLIETRNLGPNSLVLEAASNDGYLLQHYVARGIPVLGIEPAENIARIAIEEKNVPTIVRFFDAAMGRELAETDRRCNVFHAHNVFAHVPDPNEFLHGIAHCLAPDGIAVIEAPYVRDLVEKLEFDTIYHEHFSYFSASAVAGLAARNGLVLSDVEHVPIHGGTLRYFLAHDGTPASQNVVELLEAERRDGLASPGYYQRFAGRVNTLLEDLRRRLQAAKTEGARIAVYGASAKGSTMLQALGSEAMAAVDFAVDRSPLKQGRYMPGSAIPILPPEALQEEQPELTLLLTWNFAAEILRQQSRYLDEGGAFLIPIPLPRVIRHPDEFQGLTI